MLITNLEYAEKIVNNFQDLSWVGWDIVSWRADSKGFLDKNGKRVNNKWGIQTIYKITENGWHLPNKYKVDPND